MRFLPWGKINHLSPFLQAKGNKSLSIHFLAGGSFELFCPPSLTSSSEMPNLMKIPKGRR